MKKILMLILSAALLLAACAGEEPTDRNIANPFLGGNVGVVMGLVNGAPPAAVYDGGRQDFAVTVVLDNEGEADIGPGTDNPFARVRLEGFLPGAFGVADQAGLSQDLTRPLLGARKNFDGTILKGQMDRVNFFPLNYQGNLEGNYVQNFLVHFCYDYETTATVPICFKDDIVENIEDAQICTLTGEKLPQNSGGPVHVVSLVQNPLDPYEVMVNFVIEHAGSGDFYGRAADETCDPSIMNTNKYRVEVELSSEDPGLGIDCGSWGGGASGDVTLYQGAPAVVTCTLSGTGSSRIYTDLLTVKMRYRVGDQMVQPVVVQAVGPRG